MLRLIRPELVFDEYKEWADVLHEEKCGGERERPEKKRSTVKIGDKYKVYFCDSFEGVEVITAENKAWFEFQMNDPECDTWWFEKITE